MFVHIFDDKQVFHHAGVSISGINYAWIFLLSHVITKKGGEWENGYKFIAIQTPLCNEFPLLEM